MRYRTNEDIGSSTAKSTKKRYRTDTERFEGVSSKQAETAKNILQGFIPGNTTSFVKGIEQATGADLSGLRKATAVMDFVPSKLDTGFLGAAEGITDFLAGGATQLVGQKDAAKWIYEHSWSRDLSGSDVVDAEIGNESKGYQLASDLISGVGNVGFQIAVGTLIGGALAAPVANGAISQAGARAISFAPLFASASGAGTAENIAKTGELGWRENVGGLLKGGVEVLTEVISPTGKIVDRAINGKSAGSIFRYLSKHAVAKNIIVDFASEAGEEMASYAGGWFIENKLKISDEAFSARDMLYQGVLGGITGAIFAAPSDISLVRSARSAGAKVYSQGEAAVQNKINEGLIEVKLLKERGLNNDNVKLAEAALAKLTTDENLSQTTKEYYLGLAEQMVLKQNLSDQYTALAKDLVAKAKADPATAQSMADAFNAMVNEAGGEGKYTAADFTSENSEAARIYVVAQMANNWLSRSDAQTAIEDIMTRKAALYQGTAEQKTAIRSMGDGSTVAFRVGENAYAVVTKRAGTDTYSVGFTTPGQVESDGAVYATHKLSAEKVEEMLSKPMTEQQIDAGIVEILAKKAQAEVEKEQKAEKKQAKAETKKKPAAKTEAKTEEATKKKAETESKGKKKTPVQAKKAGEEASLSPAIAETEQTAKTEAKEKVAPEDLSTVEKRLTSAFGIDGSEFTKEEWTKARECVPNIDGLTRREQARVLTLVRTAQANGINEDYMKGLARLSSVYGFGVVFEDIDVSGFYSRKNGMVVINPNNLDETFGHEIEHSFDQIIKEGKAEFRTDLSEKVKKIVGASVFDRAKAQYKADYEKLRARDGSVAELSDAELEAEATANVVGKYLSNMTLLKRLAATDYSLGRGLLAAIRRMKDKWTSAKAFAKENDSTAFAEYRKMTRIEKLLMQELADARSQKRTAQGSVSYSPAGTFSEKVVSSMSMTDCSDMIRRVFNSDVRDYWEGEIKTAEQWLEERGVDEVAFNCENNENVYRKYLSKIKAYDDGDITAYDIIEAYKANALKGGERTTEKATRLDVSQERGYKDSRFYAPKEADAKRAKKTYEIASQKVTSANRAVVYEARAKFLFLAHNENAEELFGISRAEINKRLRSWSRYPAQAVEISNRINRGIPLENRWTGIQNCSILNKQTVSDSDILSMVKKIDGTSSEYKRQYIARTMLALDTHIDWSNLSFTFHRGQLRNAKGLYTNNHIDIGGDGYANTVAHEMGHALDDIWGNDILGSRQHLTESARAESAIEDADARQFLHNFRAFVDSITDSADIHSDYTQRAAEVFARFVARFVEFADYTAGNRFYQETTHYHDRFTASQFYEFARLLQEKAMLDSKRATQRTVADVSYSPAPVTRETDSRYLSLARDPQKNESELRRLVKEAAEQWGAIKQDNAPKVFYHGTSNEFWAFDIRKSNDKTGRMMGLGSGKGKIYLTEYKASAQAAAYSSKARGTGKSERVLPLYVSANKVLDKTDYSRLLKSAYEKYPNSEPHKTGYDYTQRDKAIAEVDRYVKKQGYDCVWDKESGEMFVFNSTQLKSADPVTYDDSGNIIPLSERFNPQNDDIRYSPASTNGSGRIVIQASQSRPTGREKLTNLKGELSRSNFRAALESLQVIAVNAQQGVENQLVRAGLTKREAAAFSQLARSGRSHAINAICYKFADMTGAIRSDGLIPILEPFLATKGEVYPAVDKDGNTVQSTAKGGELAGKRYSEFSDYYAMLHAIDRAAVGKNPYSSMTVAQMKQIVAEYEQKNPDFKAAAEKLSAFNSAMLDIEVQAGIISQETADLWRKQYPHYVPMYTQDSNALGGKPVRGSRNMEVRRDNKAATESDHRVSDPLRNYIDQVQRRIRAAKLNILLNEVYNSADGVNVVTAEADKAQAKDLRAREQAYLENPESENDPAEMFRKFKRGKNTVNEVSFYKDGKRVTMAVTDRIYTGLSDLGGIHSSILDSWTVKAVKKVNDTFKKLVTNWNPFFAVKNIARDLQDGTLQSRFGMGEFLNMYRKNAEMMATGKYNDMWEEFLANGGLESSLYSDEFGTFTKGGKSGLEQATGVVGQFQHIKNFNTLTEALPRFTEYCLTRKHGGSVQTALLNAADVTVNFGRSGTLIRILNSTVSPFLNPAVQGLDRVIRLFTEDGIKNNKALASLLLKAVLLAIVPMALGNAMYGDDDEYKDMKDSIKENNYLFKVGDTWLKLPRGRVVSTIAGLYNRSYKELMGEDVDWADYGKNVLDQITPAQNVARHIGSPFYDVANNRTWYGTKIESDALQNYAVNQRYDENTSRISVWIGQLTSHFGLSPKEVNYLIDQYTGVVGDILLPTTTPAGTKGVVSYNFTVDPNTSSNLSNRFYDLYNKTMYKSNDGDEEAYYLKKRLDETKSAVSELFKEIKAINASSELSNKEKVKQASAIRASINQLYKTALDDRRLYEQNIKDALAIENSYAIEKITAQTAKRYGLDSDAVGKYAVTFGGDFAKQFNTEAQANDYKADASKKTVYAEANRLTYGAEYALREYNVNVYDKAKTLNELGISYDEYYNYYMTARYYSGKTKKDKILAYLNGSGLSKSQIALMMYYSGYSGYADEAKKAIKASSLSAERKKELLAGLTN